MQAVRLSVSQVRKNSISYSVANVKLAAVDQIIGFEIDVSGGGQPVAR